MTQINKFLFETDFGAEGRTPRRRAGESREGERAAYSDDDLAGARQSGYESGIAAGRAQATAAIEARIESLLETVAERLQAVAQSGAEQRLLTRHDTARLAQAIAAKIIGRREHEGQLEVVERLVDECLAEIYGVEQVTVAVDPTLADTLVARLKPPASGIAVTVVGDSSLTGAECRIDWPGGSARRLESEMWARIEAILERYTAPTDEPAPAEPQAAGEPSPSGDDHG